MSIAHVVKMAKAKVRRKKTLLSAWFAIFVCTVGDDVSCVEARAGAVVEVSCALPGTVLL